MTRMDGMGLGILADSLGIGGPRLSPEYIEAREHEDEMAVRDVGLALAEVINIRWGRQLRAAGVDLALDSEYIREGLGYSLIAELSRAGYSVTFRPRRSR